MRIMKQFIKDQLSKDTARLRNLTAKDLLSEDHWLLLQNETLETLIKVSLRKNNK